MPARAPVQPRRAGLRAGVAALRGAPVLASAGVEVVECSEQRCGRRRKVALDASFANLGAVNDAPTSLSANW